MSDVTPLRKNLQVEETRFRFAVSESFAQKVAASLNFINAYQHAVKRWDINGDYGVSAWPLTGVDGFDPVLYDLEILDIFMFIQFAGTTGTTELDIKRATTPGGAFASIFSTTPKIAASAGNNQWVKVGSAGSGLVAPVLSLTNLDAGDVLRCDLVQAQTGAGVNGAGIVIFHRPR